eukprot:CAMPEP_0194526516 /NCGR_PEP_ID=MMETSP0253-20130528/62368_1 /TAXON_ID=2966 /ORGANISM="Noctiluca scintillans" /LENGTH=209 /DNA_ID=CAMNT_0039371349 /DNA_START=207 /DNA_END=832 /DNA_ORIENTATION=-
MSRLNQTRRAPPTLAREEQEDEAPLGVRASSVSDSPDNAKCWSQSASSSSDRSGHSQHIVEMQNEVPLASASWNSTSFHSGKLSSASASKRKSCAASKSGTTDISDSTVHLDSSSTEPGQLPRRVDVFLGTESSATAGTSFVKELSFRPENCATTSSDLASDATHARTTRGGTTDCTRGNACGNWNILVAADVSERRLVCWRALGQTLR